MKSVNARLAEELAVEEVQVAAAVRLLDEGATVPFIARYRKEATGSLDDGQLRTLEERLQYLRELDERRTAVLASIEEQGKLTDELTAALMAADTKSRVEDIYLPYKPKRRTKAQIAREAGLEPLADRLLADPTLIPEEAATEFLCDDVADAAAALDGARHILAERAAEDAELVGAIREKFWKGGSLRTAPWSDDAAKSAAAQKFRDYFEFAESLESMPSHRVLAVMRGEKEEVLALTFDGGDDERLPGHDRPDSRHRHDLDGPGDTVAGRHRRVGVAHQADDLRHGSMPASGCGSAPRRTPWRCSPGTSRTSCSPRPRVTARRSAWIPATGPASRWPSWTAPARWWTPARSTRISRRSNGIRPRQHWRRSSPVTASS